jgi:deazaflavin-dependent oxidoreductase (nitroreductase family)
MPLRRESPFRGRRLRLDEALLERALMSPAGYRYLVRLAPRLDKVLIPRTNGRLSSAGIDRVGLVTTTGATSGLPRTQPLVLLDDSDGLLAIGSNYGRPTHPAWSANLLAHPECTVEFRAAPRAIPSRAAHRGGPHVGVGQSHRLLLRLRALSRRLRTPLDLDLPPSPRRGPRALIGLCRSAVFTAYSANRRC